MKISGYYPASEHKVFVPSHAVGEDGTSVRGPDRDEAEMNSVVHLGFTFELTDGKWFALDDGVIVRFPATREWEWRAKRAEQIVMGISGSPEEKLANLRCAADLMGVDLPGLKKRLEEARESGEDLSSTFKRLSRKNV